MTGLERRQLSEQSRPWGQWRRRVSLAVSKEGCALCAGIGQRAVYGGTLRPCECALRGIFRACYGRYVQCRQRTQFGMFDAKTVHFLADFASVSRRHLDEGEWEIFHSLFLEGRPLSVLAEKQGMERVKFYHRVYRIETVLGRAFAELIPYPLFPLDEYFGGRVN
jgi:hypothetical protein